MNISQSDVNMRWFHQDTSSALITDGWMVGVSCCESQLAGIKQLCNDIKNQEFEFVVLSQEAKSLLAGFSAPRIQPTALYVIPCNLSPYHKLSQTGWAQQATSWMVCSQCYTSGFSLLMADAQLMFYLFQAVFSNFCLDLFSLDFATVLYIQRLCRTTRHIE